MAKRLSEEGYCVYQVTTSINMIQQKALVPYFTLASPPLPLP